MNLYCSESLGFHETQKKHVLTMVQSQNKYSRCSVLLSSFIQKKILLLFMAILGQTILRLSSVRAYCIRREMSEHHQRQAVVLGNIFISICISAYTNVKEYFVNLQLFGIVWTMAVTSLIFHSVLTWQEAAGVCVFSLFSLLPFMQYELCSTQVVKCLFSA